MNAQQKLAVTGATGRVGSHLVELLEGSGDCGQAWAAFPTA